MTNKFNTVKPASFTKEEVKSDKKDDKMPRDSVDHDFDVDLTRPWEEQHRRLNSQNKETTKMPAGTQSTKDTDTPFDALPFNYLYGQGHFMRAMNKPPTNKSARKHYLDDEEEDSEGDVVLVERVLAPKPGMYVPLTYGTIANTRQPARLALALRVPLVLRAPSPVSAVLNPRSPARAMASATTPPDVVSAVSGVPPATRACLFPRVPCRSLRASALLCSARTPPPALL